MNQKQYNALKKKWQNFPEKEDPFHIDRLAPAKFCVRSVDEGGIMPCCFSTACTGYFESQQEALAFYRFLEIPRILDYDSRLLNFGSRLESEDKAEATENEDPWDDDPSEEEADDEIRKSLDAEVYLKNYEPDFQERLQHLLALIDNALKSPRITQLALDTIREKYNALFKETNPRNQIQAWGSLLQILQSDCFEEEASELEGEEEILFCKLKRLLTCGKFDEYNPRHLALAKEFLESCEMVC